MRTCLGKLNVYSSLFQGNAALNDNGGAINTMDPTLLGTDEFGDVSDTGNRTALNFASRSTGGNVNAAGGETGTGTLKVISCSFDGANTPNGPFDEALTGGAINIVSATTDVEDSQFFYNGAVTSGGAITYTNDQAPSTTPYTSTLTVNLDYYVQNDSGLSGGAINAFVNISAATSGVIVTNSTFWNNQTVRPRAQGGAVAINATASEDSSTDAQFVNDTFFNNNSSGQGGGLALILADADNATSTATLQSFTVYKNIAVTDSGGVFIDTTENGVVYVDNNIIDGNPVSTPGYYNGPIDVTMTNAQALTDAGFNLVGTTDTMFNNVVNKDILNDTTGLENSTLADNNSAYGYDVPTLALATNNSPGYETGDQMLTGQKDERGRVRQAGKVSRGAEDPDAT